MNNLSPNFFKVIGDAVQYYALHGDYKEADKATVLFVAEIFITMGDSMSTMARELIQEHDLIEKIEDKMENQEEEEKF